MQMQGLWAVTRTEKQCLFPWRRFLYQSFGHDWTVACASHLNLFAPNQVSFRIIPPAQLKKKEKLHNQPVSYPKASSTFRRPMQMKWSWFQTNLFFIGSTTISTFQDTKFPEEKKRTLGSTWVALMLPSPPNPLLDFPAQLPRNLCSVEPMANMGT